MSTQKPLLFLRHTNDIFIIWTTSKELLEKLHQDFNNFHPFIKLSLDQSTQHVHFLDTMQHPKGHISNILHWKPTDHYKCLHASSFHPEHMPKSVVCGQALQYKQICLEP